MIFFIRSMMNRMREDHQAMTNDSAAPRRQIENSLLMWPDPDGTPANGQTEHLACVRVRTYPSIFHSQFPIARWLNSALADLQCV